MSRVFAIQVPSRKERGEWVSKYDLSDAERFGEVVRVLPPGNVPEDPEEADGQLRRALADFDPSCDLLLLLGDPLAIARAVRELTLRLGDAPLRALKWDRRSQQYRPCRV